MLARLGDPLGKISADSTEKLSSLLHSALGPKGTAGKLQVGKNRGPFLPKSKGFLVANLARMCSALASWNDVHCCPIFELWR